MTDAHNLQSSIINIHDNLSSILTFVLIDKRQKGLMNTYRMAAVYRRRQPLAGWNSRWFNQVQIIIYPRLYDLYHEDQSGPIHKVDYKIMFVK